jgi:DNA polymerase III psi subunit
MTISKRQFELLNAMNIPSWVSKQSNTVPKIKAMAEEVTELNLTEQLPPSAQAKPIKDVVIDLAALINNPLFNDILVTMGLLSTHTVLDTRTQNSVKIGVINWQFSDKDIMEFNNNQLITPNLQQFEKSPQLKRQLWQLIIDKELICP